MQDWKTQVWALTDAAEREINKRKYAAAIKQYEKALALVPEPRNTSPEALSLLINIAEAYYLQQKYTEALPYLLESQSFEGGKDMLTTNLRLGQIYYETGELDKARKELQYVYERQGERFFNAEGDNKYLEFLKA